MTDKKNTDLFNVDNIRKVTDKRNKHKIDLRLTKYWFPGYMISSEDYEIDFSEEIGELLENLALSYESKYLWLFKGVYERFLASNIGEDYADMMMDHTIYDRHFMVAIASKLTYKLFYKDILYVYEDGRVLVAHSREAQDALRRIRKVK